MQITIAQFNALSFKTTPTFFPLDLAIAFLKTRLGSLSHDQPTRHCQQPAVGRGELMVKCTSTYIYMHTDTHKNFSRENLNRNPCEIISRLEELTVVNDNGGALSLVPGNKILRQKRVRRLVGVSKPIEGRTVLVCGYINASRHQHYDYVFTETHFFTHLATP